MSVSRLSLREPGGTVSADRKVEPLLGRSLALFCD